MPSGIINRFKKIYGLQEGERVYYATAKLEGRDPESFRKLNESGQVMGLDSVPTYEEISQLMEKLKAQLENSKMTEVKKDDTIDTEIPVTDIPEVPGEDMPPVDTDVIAPDVDVPPISGDVPPIGGDVAPTVVDPTKPFIAIITPVSNDVPGATPPAAPMGGVGLDAPATTPIIDGAAPVDALMEKKREMKKKAVKGKPHGDSIDGKRPGYSGPARANNGHMPPAIQIHGKGKGRPQAPIADYDGNESEGRKWDKFTESSVYFAKKSAEFQIPVSRLKSYWTICTEQETLKGDIKDKSQKLFWKGVVHRFNEMIHVEDLTEAKRILSEKDNLKVQVRALLESLSKKNRDLAKAGFKGLVETALKSMISEKKVAYQQALSEKIKSRLKEEYK